MFSSNVHEDISIEQEQKAEYTEVKWCVYHGRREGFIALTGIVIALTGIVTAA